MSIRGSSSVVPYFAGRTLAPLRQAHRPLFGVDPKQGELTGVDAVTLPDGSSEQVGRLLTTFHATYPLFKGNFFVAGSFELDFRLGPPQEVRDWLASRLVLLQGEDEIAVRNGALAESSADWLLFISSCTFLTGEPLSIARSEIANLNSIAANLARKRMSANTSRVIISNSFLHRTV